VIFLDKKFLFFFRLFICLSASNIYSRMEEDLPAAVDIVMKYATYEEFLDSQVTRLDLSYLEVTQTVPGFILMIYIPTGRRIS
jgi:hypothetical protein